MKLNLIPARRAMFAGLPPRLPNTSLDAAQERRLRAELETLGFFERLN